MLEISEEVLDVVYALALHSLDVLFMLMSDDIILSSCSVNIYVNYGQTWDVQVNSRKTLCITFGSNNPKTVKIIRVLNHEQEEWLSPTERASVSAISLRHIIWLPSGVGSNL